MVGIDQVRARRQRETLDQSTQHELGSAPDALLSPGAPDRGEEVARERLRPAIADRRQFVRPVRRQE